MATMKVCARCGTPKPQNQFYASGGSYCRQCLIDYTIEWRKRFPGRRDAHRRVENALKDGRLVRAAECARCHRTRPTIAHHENYQRPLQVTWLCDQCHAIRHVELKRAVQRSRTPIQHGTAVAKTRTVDPVVTHEHAVALGRKGGRAGKGKTSPAKAAAARQNGKKGGRSLKIVLPAGIPPATIRGG